MAKLNRIKPKKNVKENVIDFIGRCEFQYTID